MAHKITEACNDCSACKKACPVLAISGGQKIHYIDTGKCIEGMEAKENTAH